MRESTSGYADASRELMGKAYQYLAEEDLRQASEKGWGAAAQMVKAVAEERGWPHRHPRLLYEVIEDLVDETGDGELSRRFRQASALHNNFYENWFRPRAVRQCLQDVQILVNRLESLIEV